MNRGISPIGQVIPVRIYSYDRREGTVAIHFNADDLAQVGLEVDDMIVLDIDGAIVGGQISRSATEVWLGTGRVPDWTGRKITSALAEKGIAPPATKTAKVTSFNKLETSTADYTELRRRVADIVARRPLAKPIGTMNPETSESTVSNFKRNPGVVAWALLQAGGKCEGCGEEAPFIDRNGQPFLEVHHVIPLAEGGPDVPDNVVALCPNCHRRAHFAMDYMEFRDHLRR